MAGDPGRPARPRALGGPAVIRPWFVGLLAGVILATLAAALLALAVTVEDAPAPAVMPSPSSLLEA